jgi:demethylmenaquinone methyltransferase/2-methoxy-6-polyprenyl-1,4-benzoquinol methylase
MNRLMTVGQDARWRRDAIRLAGLCSGDRLLDLGAGTGDLAREALRQRPDCRPVAADFTLEMMRVGRGRPGNTVGRWTATDALSLPYPDASFDAVVSGFLLRNVVDVGRSLREQYRVLKPGGRWLALDTTRPRRNLLYPLIRFHMRRVIPALGRVIAGDGDAYAYLPDSTEQFVSAEDLATRLRETGFREVGFERRMFGAIAIHWGRK